MRLAGLDLVGAPAVGKDDYHVMQQLYPNVPLETRRAAATGRQLQRPSLASTTAYFCSSAVYILLIHAVLRSDRARRPPDLEDADPDAPASRSGPAV